MRSGRSPKLRAIMDDRSVCFGVREKEKGDQLLSLLFEGLRGIFLIEKNIEKGDLLELSFCL